MFRSALFLIQEFGLSHHDNVKGDCWQLLRLAVEFASSLTLKYSIKRGIKNALIEEVFDLHQLSLKMFC